VTEENSRLAIRTSYENDKKLILQEVVVLSQIYKLMKIS